VRVREAPEHVCQRGVHHEHGPEEQVLDAAACGQHAAPARAGAATADGRGQRRGDGPRGDERRDEIRLRQDSHDFRLAAQHLEAVALLAVRSELHAVYVRGQP
jgi:hypothetical protein